MEALMDIQGYQLIFKLMNPVMRTEPARASDLRNTLWRLLN